MNPDDAYEVFDETADGETKDEKVIKVVLFENGMYVISEIEEIVAEYGMPNCKLVNPCIIGKDGYLENFPKYCGQEEILMSSDKFLTIFDPSVTILDKYIKLTTG